MSILQKIGFLVMCLPTLFFGFLTTYVQAQQTTGGTPSIEPVTLDNPLRVNSIEELLIAILNIFMVLMIPIIVLFIILAGFKYVTAQGNPRQIEEATTTFTYAIIGGVLILAAVAIAEIIRNTVDSFAA
ncbi:MAG: pilin [Candidatus Paceibacteria bacterium]